MPQSPKISQLMENRPSPHADGEQGHGQERQVHQHPDGNRPGGDRQRRLGRRAQGDIPKDKVNDLGIIYSVWLDPAVLKVDDLDHKALFDVHREATAKAVKKAIRCEPTIDWLLENQEKVTHYFHELGVKGEL